MVYAQVLGFEMLKTNVLLRFLIKRKHKEAIVLPILGSGHWHAKAAEIHPTSTTQFKRINMNQQKYRNMLCKIHHIQ